MEFVGKVIFLGPTLMEFVGARPFRTKLNGIRGQGHFGPILMVFVDNAISDQP